MAKQYTVSYRARILGKRYTASAKIRASSAEDARREAIRNYGLDPRTIVEVR